MWEHRHPRKAGICMFVAALMAFAMGFIGLYAMFLRAPLPLPEMEDAKRLGAFNVLVLLMPFGGGVLLFIRGLFFILGLKIVRIRKSGQSNSSVE